ncbi:methyltransferase [Poriferisphaera sp. WC338]|uniref:methyltransferase n=1 Tax=Poriferisphaera sp. WC338 TaxID=3425129 RepID=UPI003D8172FA
MLIQAVAQNVSESQPSRALVFEDASLQLTAGLAGVCKLASITACRRLLSMDNQLPAIPNLTVLNAAYPSTNQSFDVVLLPIPKGRQYSRLLIAAAYQLLVPNGRLYLVGQTKLGAKTIIKDAAQCFGNSETLITKKHCRVAYCIKTDVVSRPTDWMLIPGNTPGSTHQYTFKHQRQDITIQTQPGVFSYDDLDPATALLLDHMTVKPGECVWDVGCGAGPIGITAAYQGAAHVRLSDVDYHALRLAMLNLAKHDLVDKTDIYAATSLGIQHRLSLGVQGQVKLSPLPDESKTFDLIVTNPPFHSQHEHDTRMLKHLLGAARDHLSDTGRLLVVANAFLPYPRMFAKASFTHEILAETASFRLYQATPK